MALAYSLETAHDITLDGYRPEVFVRAGTLGVGPEVGIRILKGPLGLRANLNHSSYSDNSLYT